MENNPEAETIAELFISNPNKFSHQLFFRDRNWKMVENFWLALIKSKKLPSWVRGDGRYGMADLQAVHDCAWEELNNPRNKRKTYAVKVGYAGTAYQVYSQFYFNAKNI
jgi:hypothetical protein